MTEEVLNLFAKSINNKFINNQISKEDAINQLNNAIDDFAANIINNNFNKETIENMTKNTTLASFAASAVDTLELPKLLLELVETDYDSEDEAVDAFRSLTVDGEPLPDEVITGLFNGSIVPTAEEMDVICSLFPTAQDTDNYVLLQTSRHQDWNTVYPDEQENWDDVVATLEALYTQDEEIDEEDDDTEEEVEEVEETNYSANDSIVAEFNAMKVDNALSKALRKQEQRAVNLLKDEKILPSEFNAVIGEIAKLDDESDKLSHFKQWSNANYDFAGFNDNQKQLAQLSTIEFCLNVFEERPALPMFSKAVKEETQTYAAFSQPEFDEDALLKSNLADIINKKFNNN